MQHFRLLIAFDQVVILIGLSNLVWYARSEGNMGWKCSEAEGDWGDGVEEAGQLGCRPAGIGRPSPQRALNQRRAAQASKAACCPSTTALLLPLPTAH